MLQRPTEVQMGLAAMPGQLGLATLPRISQSADELDMGAEAGLSHSLPDGRSGLRPPRHVAWQVFLLTHCFLLMPGCWFAVHKVCQLVLAYTCNARPSRSSAPQVWEHIMILS